MRVLRLADITNIVRLPPSVLSGCEIVAIEGDRQSFCVYNDRQPAEFNSWLAVLDERFVHVHSAPQILFHRQGSADLVGALATATSALGRHHWLGPRNQLGRGAC